MTAAHLVRTTDPLVTPGVYPPQADSQLLIDAMRDVAPPRGLAVADLCTGSGVVALAAAADGARTVTAFDVCPVAADCVRANALAAGADIDVRHGTWTEAISEGPFDLVLCNPPYVPEIPGETTADPLPGLAVNGGLDGRRVLAPLCAAGPTLLSCGGAILLVQSEFADITATLKALHRNGLRSTVIARRDVPFGPVLHRRASWLERTGQLQPGRRTETLVVVAGVKP
jgi:release factor glutamine methyltransferase